jgi:hypothetical protein
MLTSIGHASYICDSSDMQPACPQVFQMLIKPDMNIMMVDTVTPVLANVELNR